MTTNKEIHTIVPIPVEHIRSYFKDKSIYFYLDYAKSKIKNKPFLTYIGNNGIPCEVLITDEVTKEERFLLIRDFMEIRVIIQSPLLARTVSKILLRYNNLEKDIDFTDTIITLEQADEFIEENKELIVRWSVFLHSCLLYLIYTTIDLNDVIKVEEKFEHIDDPDYIGLNACQLFAVEDFYISFIAGTIPEKLYFFTRQFTESIFRGSKLIKYFDVNENHFYAILQGLIINEIPLSIISEDEFVVKDK